MFDRTLHTIGFLQVFVCARNDQDVSALIKEWLDKGYKVQGCRADVSKREEIQELLKQVRLLVLSGKVCPCQFIHSTHSGIIPGSYAR